MDDRAKQIAALMTETYRQSSAKGFVESLADTFAAVLAPWFERIERLEAERKPAMELKTGSFDECFAKIRAAGGDVWDTINDPEGYLRWVRGDDDPAAVAAGEQASKVIAARDAAPPAPVPQPGATHRAEVAAMGAPATAPPATSPASEVAERMITTFAANVRWICTKAIEAERAAARREAIDEAEGAVYDVKGKCHQDSSALSQLDIAAEAVARLGEVGA